MSIWLSSCFFFRPDIKQADISEAAWSTSEMGDAYVFCISCMAESFVHFCADNRVDIEGLTSFLSRKVQLATVYSNLSFKLSGLNSFCHNIFETHDMKD